MVVNLKDMPPMPEKKNPVSIVGTWNGFGFPDIPKSLKQTPLNDLLNGVKTDSQAELETPEIQRLKRSCYTMLMTQTKLTTTKIHNLLNFDGLPHVLSDLCRQAGLTMGIRGQARQLELLRSARVNRYWELLKAGALGFKAKQEFGAQPFNLVLDIWMLFVQYLMTGQDTSPSTFDIKTCAVGCSSVEVDGTQTNLQNMVGYKAPDTYILTGYQTTWLTGFLPEDANGPETTLQNVPDTPQGLFEIDPADDSTFDAKVGDRIIFFGPGLDPAGEKRTILFFPYFGDTTTFSISEELSALPEIGTTIRKIWSESGLSHEEDGVTVMTRFLIDEDGGYDKGNGTTVANGVYVESAITLRVVPD